MAIVTLNGFEEGSAARFVQSAGTFSVQSTVVNRGGFALRTNPTTTGAGAAFFAPLVTATAAWFGGIIDVTNLYSQFYFRFATAPSSGSEPIAQARNSGFGVKLELRLNSTGVLSVYAGGGTVLVDTGTTVLQPDTWYRIAFRAGNGTTAAYEVQIDGASELSGTADQGATNVGYVVLGKATNRNSNTVDFFYDDFCADDADWPPEAVIAPLLPDGAGTGQFTSGGTGSVDDRPHDSDAGYIASSVAFDQQIFTIVEATLGAEAYAVLRFGVVRDEGGVSSMAVGGSGALSSSFDPGASYNARGRLDVSNPNTSLPWTAAEVQATTLGVVNFSNVAVRCTLLMGEVLMSTPADAGNGGGGVSVATREPLLLMG